MSEWKVWAKMIKIPGEKMLKLQFETPDAGVGQALYDNLQRLYRYSQEENIFANPLLILNDPDVPDYAGGQVGVGTGEFSQGKPIIEIPPSQSGTVYITPPDPNDPNKKTVRVVLNLEQAVIILHELNHAIHRFVNHGEYMHPKSSRILGAVDQNLNMGVMSKALQSTFDMGAAYRYKKANEMETYWLCCCNAAKYHFGEAAITAIKSVNNMNLLAAGYEKLANQKQLDAVNKNKENHELLSKLYDIDNEDPTQFSPPSDDVFNGFDDEQQ